MKLMSQRTIAVLLGVEGNELIEHSFFTDHSGVNTKEVRRSFDAKEGR
jgi:hypothetical protein